MENEDAGTFCQLRGRHSFAKVTDCNLMQCALCGKQLSFMEYFDQRLLPAILENMNQSLHNHYVGQK